MGVDQRLERAGARGVILPPDAASASRARSLLRERLAAADYSQWTDAAELAISELVTNAALHAHTSIEIDIDIDAHRVRVEVRDFNPLLPALRRYDRQATTGRGMALVAALTRDCGVIELGPDGKVVWFEVADTDHVTDLAAEGYLLGAWDFDDLLLPDAAPTADADFDVLLPHLPPTLYLAARQHHDALLRELVLYCAAHDDIAVDFPLTDQARRLISDALDEAIEVAERSGPAEPAVPFSHPSLLPRVPRQLDLHVRVPAGSGPAFEMLAEALDAAERLAAAERLLVYPGLPEIVEVRDWVCHQVIAQLAGVEPLPWEGAAHERFEIDARGPHPRPEPQWDASAVRNSERGVVAADDTNRIVAVSRTLAEWLGWDVEDLVGRRVVTLIPPSLREAHVAGFSRHLSTGEAHALGTPLTLPVLRSDGSEVQCHFLVERAPANPGRSVYVAWIEPLTD